MAQVMDIVAKKGAAVHVVAPEATVLEATQLMNRQRIGALVVTEGGKAAAGDCSRVVGMFTERDVLMRVVALQRDPVTTRVADVMTRDVAYCRPDMDLEEVSVMMQERRIRHLPVCDGDGRLRGVVSILEDDCKPQRTFDGLICLSNPEYDLYQERPDPAVSKGLAADSEKWGHLLDSLFRYFDGDMTILDIAERHNLPFGQVRAYLGRFESKGLIRLSREPLTRHVPKRLGRK